MVPEIEIETEHLLLREFRRSDEDDFLIYAADEEHWRHLPVEPPTSQSLQSHFARLYGLQHDEPRIAYELIVTDKYSDAFFGEASLYLQPPFRSASIGWAVVQKHSGRGIATEMSAALLYFAFTTLEVHRIQANCRVENLASRRIMAKLGMREEGISRDHLFIRGEWWSSVQAAILSNDPECLQKGYIAER